MNKPNGVAVVAVPALDRFPSWAQEAVFLAYMRRNTPVPAFLASAALRGFPVAEAAAAVCGKPAAPLAPPATEPAAPGVVFDSGRSMAPGSWAGRVSGISYSDAEADPAMKPESHVEVAASKMVPGMFPKRSK